MSFDPARGQLLSDTLDARKGSHEADVDLGRGDERQHPLRLVAAPRQARHREPRPVRPDGTVGSSHVQPHVGAGLHRRRFEVAPLLRAGLGFARCPRTHCAAHHRSRAVGAMGPGGRRPPGRRRRRDVPAPSDAGVGPGRSPAFADRHGLGRHQRWKHGDDAPHRAGLRGMVGRTGRPHPRSRRLLDLPAPRRVPDQQGAADVLQFRPVRLRRPGRYREPRRLATIPSKPAVLLCATMVAPSPAASTTPRRPAAGPAGSPGGRRTSSPPSAARRGAGRRRSGLHRRRRDQCR